MFVKTLLPDALIAAVWLIYTLKKKFNCIAVFDDNAIPVSGFLAVR